MAIVLLLQIAALWPAVIIAMFWLGFGARLDPPFRDWANRDWFIVTPLWMQILFFLALLLANKLLEDWHTARKRKQGQLDGLKNIKPCSRLGLAAALKTANFCTCLDQEDLKGATDLLNPFATSDDSAPIPLLMGEFYGDKTALHRLAACKTKDERGHYRTFYDSIIGGVALSTDRDGTVAQFLNLPCKRLGYTALHYACFSKNETIWGFLLADSRVDVNARSINGYTPLFEAAAHDDVKAIAALLKRRAGPNAKCDEGKTPLIAAVLEGREHAVGALLNLGYEIDVGHATNLGVTAMSATLVKLNARATPNRSSYESIRDALDAAIAWRIQGIPYRGAEIEKCLRAQDPVMMTEVLARSIVSVILIYMD
jgi:hypothetical protein